MSRPPVTVAVTDHAVERFLQRVRGVLYARPAIVARVQSAWMADRVGPGRERASVHVRDAPLVPREFTDALRRERA